MDAHECQAAHWELAEPLPAQGNPPVEVNTKIALNSYLNYSVDILTWHSVIFMGSRDGKSDWFD